MFAGIGGFRSGLTRAGGFRCVGHCEIDKYANASYQAIYEPGKEERYYANSDHATVRVGKCNQVNGKGFRVNPCALAVKERRFHRTTYLFNRHFAAHARTPSS